MSLPRFFNSIRWRLLLWIGFLLAFLLTGFGFTAFQLNRTNTLRQIDAQLETRVTVLSASLRSPPPGRNFGERPGRFPDDRPMGPPDGRRGGPGDYKHPGGPRDHGGPEFHDAPEMFDGGPPPRPFGPPGGPFGRREVQLSGEALRLFDEGATNSFFYAMWSRGGFSLKQSTNAPIDLAIPERPGRDTSIHLQNRGHYREAYHYTELGDCVLAGISLEPFHQVMRGFTLRLSVAGLAVLAVGLGGAWWLATRAIKPVDEISATANRIAAGNLSERISARDTASELGRLAGTLNSTFARLEAAFSQQRQFTADASHELRTPLAVIISETQGALNRERESAEYRESLKVCHDAAQQMRGLANSLLELARLDAGEEKITREPVDLAQIAELCISLLRPLAREKNIQISVDLREAPASGDKQRLSQVLMNLLQNAVFYTPEGGQVRVTTGCHTGESTIVISDTGIGISAEDLPHIFKRFYRADKARGRHEGHAGLGLAISKAIVDLHGGVISATSSPGEGTTFRVALPASESRD